MSKLKRLIYGITIAAIAIAIAFYRSSQGNIGITVDGSSLAISSPVDQEFVIPFERIRSVELAAEVEFGELLEGEAGRYIRRARWENERWGVYRLCVKNAIPSVIVVETEDGIFVFNYLNSVSTESLAEAILDLLEEPAL